MNIIFSKKFFPISSTGTIWKSILAAVFTECAPIICAIFLLILFCLEVFCFEFFVYCTRQEKGKMGKSSVLVCLYILDRSGLAMSSSCSKRVLLLSSLLMIYFNVCNDWQSNTITINTINLYQLSIAAVYSISNGVEWVQLEKQLTLEAEAGKL